MNTVPGVTGNKMRTVSGRFIDFADPQPNQFTLEDIATGLGSECRFGNQLDRHYSVAEHSLHCLAIASMWKGVSVSVKRAVLMHDAAEAFCLDIPKPLKIMLPNYGPIEDQVYSVIATKYGINPHSQFVKHCDLIALKAEKTYFGEQDDQHDLSEIANVTIPIKCYCRRDATELFLAACQELGIREVRS